MVAAVLQGGIQGSKMQIRIYFSLLVFNIFLVFFVGSVYASKSDIGLTCDKKISPEHRYIEVGDTVSYTIEHLEKNKYRCGEF